MDSTTLKVQYSTTALLGMSFADCLALRNASIASPEGDSDAIHIALVGDIDLTNLQIVLHAFLATKGFSPHFTYVRLAGARHFEPREEGLSALDAVVTLLSPEAAADWLFQPTFLDMDVKQKERAIEDTVSTLIDMAKSLSDRTESVVVLTNLALPSHLLLGSQDGKFGYGQLECIYEVNRRLIRQCQDLVNVFLVDLTRCIGSWNERLWRPAHTWDALDASAFMDVLRSTGLAYLSHLYAIKRAPRKCIVLDLDNTLWGGVVGEVGPDGVQLGSHHEGLPYLEFQRQLYGLSKRGILITVASKNNSDEALAVIDHHPHMILRDVVVAMKINWEPKPQNIERLARELNIGLESMVFLDDSPYEREAVRAALPMVLVPDLPADPRLYSDFLEALVEVQPLRITEEALGRTRSYKIRAERERMSDSFSVDEMNRQLHTRVVVTRAPTDSAPRISELCIRTNQFNLTNRRYAERDIRRFMEDDTHIVMEVRVADDYEDLGIVGVVILEQIKPIWRIDVFLLSCRVVSRNIETAAVAVILELARRHGIETLRGEYMPTERNRALVSRFYPDHFFQLRSESTEEETSWDYSVSDQRLTMPTGIETSLEDIGGK